MRKTSRLSPAATIAVLFATALVSFAFFLQASVKDNLERAVRVSVPDASVVVTGDSSGATIPASLAHRIRSVPGVTGVKEQVFGIGVADDELGAAVGVQSLIDATGYDLVDGRLPAGDNEALLVMVPDSPTRYVTGAEIAIKGQKGNVEKITIVGTATAELGATEAPDLPTLICSFPAAQRLLGIEGSTRLLVNAEGDSTTVRAEINDAATAQRDSLAVQSVDEYAAANASKFATGARTVMVILGLLTAVSILAALVVVGNTYKIQLARSTREIALLRCIGALRRQVFVRTVINAVFVGALGATGGIALGAAIGVVVLGGVPTAAAYPGFWGSLFALGLAAGVFPSVLAAARPARRAAKIAPIEALRQADPDSARTQRSRRVHVAIGLGLIVIGIAAAIAGGVSKSLYLVILGVVIACGGLVLAAAPVFTWVAGVLGALGGSRTRNADEQLKRNPARSGATAVAVWLGTTLLTTLLIGGATAQSTLTEAVDGSTPTDVFVTPDDDPNRLANRINRLSDVTAATPVAGIMLDAEFATNSNPLNVVGWTPELLNVLTTESHIPEPDPGTIILPPTPDTTRGEGPVMVTLKQDGYERTFTVMVIDGAPMLGIMNRADLNELSGVSQDVWVALAPDVDTLNGMDTVAGIPGVAALSSPALQRQQLNKEIGGYINIAIAFIAVALLISVVGLSNAVALSVTERTREFGLLRALGALRRQVVEMILTETLLLAGAAGVVGVGFGIVFGVSASHALLGGEQLHVVIDIPWLTLAMVLAGLMVACVLAALLPARRAAHIPPVAALGK